MARRLVRALAEGTAMALILTMLTSVAGAQESLTRRQETLKQLLRLLPESAAWDTWLQNSGELPPDFDTMPSVPLLPDPLMWNEGTPEAKPLQSPEEWPRRRAELLAQFQHWILGTVPPRPDSFTVTVLKEEEEAGSIVREVELRFGPDDQAHLWCRLYIPKGDGPFPVFMTQENHNAWGLIALSRGYLVCVYAGSDSRDDTDSFLPAYPDYDWSRLMRRAWAAGRCIDYLETVPQANVAQIALTGHSRNGKQSLMASAIDERIATVISSSSGAGGPLATRHYSEQHFGEGIENITRVFPEWFHPRWRFFVGREDRLPIDMHELVVLSAPRPCLLSTAINDGVESTWAMEQTYRFAKRVYDFLGAPEGALRIMYRPVGHETWTTVIERYVDWCDLQFGRGEYAFPERLIHPWDWDTWRTNATSLPDPEDFPRHEPDATLSLSEGSTLDWPDAWNRRRAELREAVAAMLGTAPPGAESPGGTYGEEPDHIERQLGRFEAGEGLQKEDLVFGEYINADVYLPREIDTAGVADDPIPAVLWLHPVHNAHGYGASYRRGEQFFRTLARHGYAVFCFDQIGYGRRVAEAEGFYTRHPGWSLLGKMVRDARAALDAMERLPYVEHERIFVVGYGLGAMVAEHLAVFDDRPAGYALVCGPQPFRCDTPDRQLGGLARWAKLHMWLPNLGAFEGHEDRIPYDVPDLLAAMAPRPACVISATLDRELNLADATRAVEAARQVYDLYDVSERLTQLTPVDYNRFGPEMQGVVIDWLKATREE